MSTFAWVMLAIVVFMGGQWMMMRPNPREQALLRLREAARKKGLQPRLLPPPDWLPQERRHMVAAYTLIIPSARMPYWRAMPREGQWTTVSGSRDLLAGVVLPPVASRLLAIEGQANAMTLYWEEAGGEELLDDLKAFLQVLAANA